MGFPHYLRIKRRLKAMISLKHFAALVATALLVVSCSPYPPEAGTVMQVGPDPAVLKAQRDAEQKAKNKADAVSQEKAAVDAKKRAELKKKAKEREAQIADQKTTFEPKGYRPPLPEPKKKKPKYPTAKKIPGKAGFVFNPFTYDPVDVRGIPGGSLVVDPNDPNKNEHKFRVP